MNPWDQFVNLFADGIEVLAGAFGVIGDHRWAAAIVALTVIVKTLLIPVAIRQVRSTQAMQRIQPEMQRLQKKHRNDRERLAREQQELFRREGVNPLSCMLPMIFQMPIFFAIYYAIRNLSNREDVAMPFIGLGDLTDKAGDLLIGAGGLLIALMVVTQIWSMRQVSTAQNPQQQKLLMIMPVGFAFIMLSFPLALVLYWTVQNVYTVVQQRMLLRRYTKPDEISTKAIAKGTKTNPNGASRQPSKGKKTKNVKRRSR